MSFNLASNNDPNNWTAQEKSMEDDFDYDIYSVDSSSIRTDKYQNALADLTRQQFEDYKTRFLPVQEELFGLATSDKKI